MSIKLVLATAVGGAAAWAVTYYTMNKKMKEESAEARYNLSMAESKADDLLHQLTNVETDLNRYKQNMEEREMAITSTFDTFAQTSKEILSKQGNDETKSSLINSMNEGIRKLYMSDDMDETLKELDELKDQVDSIIKSMVDEGVDEEPLKDVKSIFIGTTASGKVIDAQCKIPKSIPVIERLENGDVRVLANEIPVLYETILKSVVEQSGMNYINEINMNTFAELMVDIPIIITLSPTTDFRKDMYNITSIDATIPFEILSVPVYAKTDFCKVSDGFIEPEEFKKWVDDVHKLNPTKELEKVDEEEPDDEEDNQEETHDTEKLTIEAAFEVLRSLMKDKNKEINRLGVQLDALFDFNEGAAIEVESTLIQLATDLYKDPKNVKFYEEKLMSVIDRFNKNHGHQVKKYLSSHNTSQ